MTYSGICTKSWKQIKHQPIIERHYDHRWSTLMALSIVLAPNEIITQTGKISFPEIPKVLCSVANIDTSTEITYMSSGPVVVDSLMGWLCWNIRNNMRKYGLVITDFVKTFIVDTLWMSEVWRILSTCILQERFTVSLALQISYNWHQTFMIFIYGYHI